MFSPLLKYKKGITVTIVAILLIILINFSYSQGLNIAYFDDFFELISAPFNELFSSVSNSINDVLLFFVNIRDLSQENQELKEKLAEYENIKLEKNELKKENQRLREMLEFDQRAEFKLEPAGVIGRDPNTWNQMIKINRGAEDGIEVDMPVITADGLVGRVFNVNSSTSQVLLILDPGSAIGSIVQSSRVTGITEGRGDNSGKLQLINLPKDVEVDIGDTIITSGQGPVFPEGLRIGEVSEIEDESLGFTKRAIITPSVSFQRLEEVFVVSE